MYSWVDILLEEAALSRKKSEKQFNKNLHLDVDILWTICNVSMKWK
jgi:hypothetical protein